MLKRFRYIAEKKQTDKVWYPAVIWKRLMCLTGKPEKEETEPPVMVMKENPFLPHFRELLEQLLERCGVSYQDFRPLILDRDTEPESMLTEDDVALVLEQISEDLNFLRIATERPAYFSCYIEKMYEENGLIVQVQDKNEVSAEGINAVLDMEQTGGIRREFIRENVHYVPVYKRPWNQAQNLDISIPIGYNTVIVKGI